MAKKMTLGQRLRQARRAQGMTQTEMGRRINRTHATISYWEGDLRVPEPKMVPVLSALLDIPIEVIAGEDKQKKRLRAGVESALY